MTLTPADLLATAARYDLHYGCRPGDGGTSDMLRAGAEAMRRVLEVSCPCGMDEKSESNLCSAGVCFECLGRRVDYLNAKLAALQETQK